MKATNASAAANIFYIWRVKIAVNTRFLLPNKLEGIGWFTYEVFKRLTQNHPEVEWIFLFDRPYKEHFIFADNITPVVVPPPARHPVLWHIWFEYSLPRIFKKHQPDLFISTDGYLSLKSKVKSIAVIHDLNFEHNPENIPRIAGKFYRKNFPKYAEKADRIATVSEYSGKDIQELYGTSADKIDLVYNGCGDFFFPLPPEEITKVRQEVTGGVPYFIFVGALNPRKNITGMLAAFEKYREAGGQNKFVIVGEKMFWSDDIAQAYEGHPYKEDILFTGRLEGSGLNKVLASSAALLFVSNFEGFGIPIVEAFKCEVPVITSTTTSMPEVAGDAALLCDPANTDQIAEAMLKMNDEDLRQQLIAKGKLRSNLFTWDRSAEMMWECITKTLNP